MSEAVVHIERLGAQGDGIATWQGSPLYVPFALPGEDVKVRIEGDRANLVDILHQSPHRVASACPHFGVCGGCAVQHLSPESYPQWKIEQIRTALSHRGLDIPIEPPHISPPGSRRRTKFTVRRSKGGIALGFAQRRSHALVDITACPVTHPDILAVLPVLRRSLQSLLKARDATVQITRTDSGLDVDLTGVKSEGASALMALADIANDADLARLSVEGEVIVTRREPVVHFGGVAVTPPPVAFLQATRDGEAALIDLVRAGTADSKRVADLFSGIGTFALSLESKTAVTAPESDASAVSALQAAARTSNRPITARRRDLFRDPLTAEELKAFDAAIVDPPRAGAAAQTAMIAASRLPLVVMISCNPATFARDARMLVDAGFSCPAIQPVDQFLWSPHVELAAVFRR